MHTLRYRQIHLDFHTSPDIENIGGRFDKAQWQDMLRRGHVDSITCFAVGHHGWSYYDTKVGFPHPHLQGDLLRSQFDAAKEIDVNVPIYITAGLHDVMTAKHPDWREHGPDGRPLGPSPFEAGFRKICFNTPFLDHLCEQIREVVTLYPDCDGIFLDIIHQGPCCCSHCVQRMRDEGLDPTDETDRATNAHNVLMDYYRRTTEAARCDNPEMPIFHNSGHITRGDSKILPYFSHLELESLPTGGWGYDHFPISAKYCTQLDLDFLGMTGKFHTTWGEFGGYKHPNALRYECAAMLAWGAKCSIGDQLHPEGLMDPTTYDIIGQAYSEVEVKEPFCLDAKSVADIALLSSEAVHNQRGQKCQRDNAADIGAGRILLECHFLWDMLDASMDFSTYRMLILPDEIKIDAPLKARIDEYLAAGGKVLLTGYSGLSTEADGFAFDIGATWSGQSPCQPDFILPIPALRPDFLAMPLVMYLPSQRVVATGDAQPLGDIYDPYFNRDYTHYCSHQHAPARPEPSGFHCAIRNGNILYLAHPVFTIYRGYGAVAYQDYAVRAIRSLLDEPTVQLDGLPSTGRVSLTDQPAHNRLVLHLLYANTIQRGGPIELSGGSISRKPNGVEVIQELLPLRDVTVTVRPGRDIKAVTAQPQGQDIPFTQADGVVTFPVDEFTCHQMIALEY
jgi:hypothetical protein